MSPERERLRDRLFDILAAKAEGLDIDQITGELETTDRAAKYAVRDLRLFLGEDDINLICEPVAQGQRWIYKLVGRYEDAAWWLQNRAEDQDARIQTMLAIAQAMVNNSDGRTIDGRKARLRLKFLSRLQEDLRDAEVPT